MNKIKKSLFEWFITQILVSCHPSVDMFAVDLNKRTMSVMTREGAVYQVFPGEQKIIESKH
jgi:hypothetical protein